MSQRTCCVPGCSVTVKDGVPLHRFPDPNTYMEKFNSWVSNIGGELAALDNATIYNNRRVCNKHFKDIYKYPKNRLCQLAIPDLHVPGPSFAAAMSQDDVMTSTSGVKNVLTPGHQNVIDTSTMKTQKHVAKNAEKKGKKTNKLKGSHVSIQQLKKYESVLKQLRKSEQDKMYFKRKYLAARKLQKQLLFKLYKSTCL